MDEGRLPIASVPVQAVVEVDRRLPFELEPVALWVTVRPGTRILALLILAWKRRRRGEWLPTFPWLAILLAWLAAAALAAALAAVALILRMLSTPVGG